MYMNRQTAHIYFEFTEWEMSELLLTLYETDRREMALKLLSGLFPFIQAVTESSVTSMTR